jgi:hypothetical protein
LMQDRSPLARQNPLATHGWTIHLGQNSDLDARNRNVCFAPAARTSLNTDATSEKCR